MSPMCCDTNASASRVSVNVLFCSGPCGEHGVSARRGRRSTNVSEGFHSVGPFRWLT